MLLDFQIAITDFKEAGRYWLFVVEQWLKMEYVLNQTQVIDKRLKKEREDCIDSFVAKVVDNIISAGSPPPIDHTFKALIGRIKLSQMSNKNYLKFFGRIICKDNL